MSQGNYTIEEANAILYENYNNYLKKLQEKGIQIIDSSVKIEEVDGSYVMNGIVYVNQIQNMHVPVDIDSQNDSLKDVNVR